MPYPDLVCEQAISPAARGFGSGLLMLRTGPIYRQSNLQPQRPVPAAITLTLAGSDLPSNSGPDTRFYGAATRDEEMATIVAENAVTGEGGRECINKMTQQGLRPYARVDYTSAIARDVGGTPLAS